MLFRTLLAALLVSLLTACAVTPQQRRSLDTYVSAMDQVLVGADEVLADMALRSSRLAPAPAQAASATLGYPDALTLPADDMVPTSEPGRSIAASRRSLEILRSYNAVLVALAEGRSEEELKGQITGLGSSIKSLGEIFGASVPAFAPFAEIGARIFKLAQDAQNRKELEAAVQHGREPVMATLDALETQAAATYKLSVVEASREQRKHADAIRAMADRFAAHTRQFGAPNDAAAAAKAAQVEAELGAIGSRTNTREKLLPLRWADGRPPIDAAAWDQTEVYVQAFRDASRQHAEVATRQSAFHAVLVRHVLAVRQARSSLDQLAASLAAPTDLREQTAQLLRAALGLRDAISTYRNPAPAAS